MGSLRVHVKRFHRYQGLICVIAALLASRATAQNPRPNYYNNQAYRYVHQAPALSQPFDAPLTGDRTPVTWTTHPESPPQFGSVYNHYPERAVVRTVSYPDGWQQRSRPLDPLGDSQSSSGIRQNDSYWQEPVLDPAPDPPAEDAITAHSSVARDNQDPDSSIDSWQIEKRPNGSEQVAPETQPLLAQAGALPPCQSLPNDIPPSAAPFELDENDPFGKDRPAELMLPEIANRPLPGSPGESNPSDNWTLERADDLSGWHSGDRSNGQSHSYMDPQVYGNPEAYRPTRQPMTNRNGYPRQFPSSEFQIPDPAGKSGQMISVQNDAPALRRGESSFFAPQRQAQHGIAGYEELVVENASAGQPDCRFDCGTPTFYLTGYGGSVDLHRLVSGNNSLLTNDGGGFGIALGQRQGRNLRTEIDYGLRSNAIVGFDDGVSLESFSGKIKSQSGMANVYWEFVNFPRRRWKPYMGAGLGFTRIETELNNGQGQPLTLERSEDSSFAYQFIGGVNYRQNRFLDLFIEYRLFQADSFAIETSTGQADGHYDYRANNLIGGIRWKF